MIKINKDYNIKISLLLITVLFILNSAAYGINTLTKSCLRIPVGQETTRKRMISAVRNYGDYEKSPKFNYSKVFEFNIYGGKHWIPAEFWRSIRPARQDDLSVISRLYIPHPYQPQEVLPASSKTITQDPPAYWVFEHDGKVLGFVGIDRKSFYVTMTVLRVDTSVLRQGIDYVLYTWALFQAQKEGYGIVVFDDVDPNAFHNDRIRKLREIWGDRFRVQDDAAVLRTTDIKSDNFRRTAYERITILFPSDANRILEVGTGSAKNLIHWVKENSNRIAVGIDVAREALITSQRGAMLRGMGKQVQFVEYDASGILPLVEGSFDAVFNEGVLEHYPYQEIPHFLAEMVRVTKPGGSVVVAVPNYYSFSLRFALWWNGVDYRDVSKTPGLWRYGYEQPQKPEVFKEFFEQLGLVDIELDGFAPLYGFGVYQWDSEHQKAIYPWYAPLLRVVVRISDPILYAIDAITNRWVSRKFGYEFVIKGVKPPPAMLDDVENRNSYAPTANSI